jgi:hypothetical protein
VERKFPLVIHVDPVSPVSLNKTCRFCPRCDLLIAHRDELEAQLTALFEKHNPRLIGNDYLVLGTLDPDVWERGRQTPLTIQATLDNLHDFVDVLRIQPADEGGRPLRERPGKRLRRQRPRPGDRGPPPGSGTQGSAPERGPGRNDPCWCGSGKKYRHCHLRPDTEGNP